jgi:GTP-binding protein Era
VSDEREPEVPARPFRCGHVAIVGRTNAGKSTLVNRLVGEKVSIVSPVPQTTRNLVIGVRNEPDAQLVLVDTPGFHAPEHAMNRRMIEDATGSMSGVDVIVQLIDVSDAIGKGDAFVTSRAKGAGPPLVIALSKVDRVRPKERLLPIMERLAEEGAAAIVPISAVDGTGLEGLVAEIRERLPESPAIYPKDITTDQTERFLIAELVREKILLATRQEIPHATTVLVESVEEKIRPDGRTVLVVGARIAVEKENQKAILIGKGGSMLKRVGSDARRDIESLLNVRCHLSLEVAVMARWREDPRVLDRIFEGTRAMVAGTGEDE